MSTHISISGASLVIGGNSSYTHSTTDSRSVDVSAAGFDFVASGSTAIAAGDGLDNIDLNGNTFEIGNADTVTFPILDGATGGIWRYATGVTPPTIIADTSGALEGILELPVGEYRIENADISGLTINPTAGSSGTITVRTFNTTGTITGTGTGVTVEALPDTRSYVVPAQAGNFIVRRVGAGSSDPNEVQRSITSSSSVAELSGFQ